MCLMENYSIWVDASADLDMERIGGQVRVLPMEYTQGDARKDSFSAETDAERHAFYDIQRGGAVTHTSQIAPMQYREQLGPVMDREGVLYLALSGSLTQTVDSALSAREKLLRDHVHSIQIVDTLSATGGIGLLAEIALENRARGMSLEENAASVREWAGRVCHCFMVEDLMYLMRGGRVSAATAVMGTVMGIRPILVIDREGRLITVGRIRGQKAAEKELLRFFGSAREQSSGRRVFIVHGDAPEAAAEMRSRLLDADPALEISVRPLCPVIGAHTGPGMLGVIFFGSREKIMGAQ